MLRLFIMLGFLLVVFSLFYIFVLDTTLKNEANRLAFENHQMNQAVLSDRLEVLSQSYSDGNLDWLTKDYDDTNLVPEMLAEFEINAFNRIFNDETSTTIYLILKHPTLDQVAYKPLSDVLSVIGINFGDSGLIINANNMIKFHTNQALLHTNLFTSTIFPSSAYTKLDTELYESDEGFLNYSEDGQSYVLSHSTLSGNYYYLSHQSQYDYLALFTPVIWSFMALGILTLATFTIFSLMVVKRRFDDDIVFDKLTKTLKSNLLIIEVGGLGQVRKSNELFTKLAQDYDFKTLTEYTSETLDIQQLLKNKQPFYIELDKLEPSLRARFLVNKYGRNYQLIGEVIDSNSNVLDKYKDLALTNQDTGLKNKLALEETIDTLDRKDKFSFIILGIKSFDDVSKNIGRDKTKEVTSVLIELIEEKLYPNMHLFHIDRNEFVVLQMKDINYDVTVGWARKMIDLIDKKILLTDLPVKLELDCGVVHNRDIISNFSALEIIDALEVTLERARVSTTSSLMIF